MIVFEYLNRFGGGKIKGVIPFAILFSAWLAVSRFGLVAAETLPSPLDVSKTFLHLSATGELGTGLLKSLARIAWGFVIGCGSGFVLGAAMGISRPAERLLSPLVNAVRQVPIIGWIPLIIVWCGIKDMSKISFIAIGAFFPMVINTFAGIRAVSGAYLEVGRVFEFDRLKLLRSIILPAALPGIVTGIRLSLGTSWMLVVWSEINTSSDLGIGDMIWSARESSRMDVIIVGLAVIAAVAYLINGLLGILEARLSLWQKTYR